MDGCTITKVRFFQLSIKQNYRVTLIYQLLKPNVNPQVKNRHSLNANSRTKQSKIRFMHTSLSKVICEAFTLNY